MEVDTGTSGGAVNVEMEEADGEAPRLEQLKLRYYRQMVQVHEQDDKTLEVCRCYLSMFHTPSVQRDAALFLPILRSVCWYLVLSQSEPMQVSLLEQVFNDAKIDKDDSLKRLLNDFRSELPVSWAEFQEKFAGEMGAQEVFSGEGGAAKREALPRLTAEVGDTWVYGAPSDPQKQARARVMNRAFAGAITKLGGKSKACDARW